MNDELWSDPRWTEFALGEMPPDEAKAFEAALQDQPDKLAFVAELRQAAEACQTHYAFEAASTATAADAATQKAQPSITLAKEASGGRRTFTVALLAASVLLVVGGLLGPKLFRNGRSDVAMDAVLSAGEKASSSGMSAEAERLLRNEVGSGSIEAELAQIEFDLHAADDHPLDPQALVDDSRALVRQEPAMSHDDAMIVSGSTRQPSSERPVLSKRVMAETKSMSSARDRSGPSSGVVASSAPETAAEAAKRRSMSTGPVAGAVVDFEAVELEEVRASVETDETDSDSLFAMGDSQSPSANAPARVAGREGLQRQAGVPVAPSNPESYFGRSTQGDSLGFQNETRGLTPQQRASMGGLGGGYGFRGDGLDPTKQIPEGTGPGSPGDRYDPIEENEFKKVGEHPLSTFSIDVDTASYTKVRGYLRNGQLPRPDMVRIEEFINYFDYELDAPSDDAEHPFATDVAITSCPWNDGHHLARISLAGKTMSVDERPPANLVFLIDTSGSMNQANKLPLVVNGLKLLTKQLGKNDRVAIVVYAGSAGLVLDSTPAKKKRKKQILSSLQQLNAGGSTNGGAGIALAYNVARDHFIEGGVNRVILCSDGDFNVGTTSTDALVDMVEKEAKSNLFLTVLGFGYGNHNDAMMEQISGRGNGNYGFIDTESEAEEWFVKRLTGTLVTIAKDVKLQIEFSPQRVGAYRLIGYENRVLAKEDFNDDKKDAGEIGAGHQVTALYELVPPGIEPPQAKPDVDPLRYQSTDGDSPANAPEEDVDAGAKDSGEWMFVKLRYKQPEGTVSTKIEVPVRQESTDFDGADANTRWAATVAGFGMQLRGSEFVGSWKWSDVHGLAKALAADREGDGGKKRREFVNMVRQAGELMGEVPSENDADETASVGSPPSEPASPPAE